MFKKSSFKHFVTLNNKKYFYTLMPASKKETFVECEAAHIAQPFLNEDIPELLCGLPELILSEKKYQENQEAVIRFRVSVGDKKEIEQKALKKGFKSVSEFLRSMALQS
jgi:hypothetical protein